LLFYFTSYVLNMFRTLIYPSSGACDCAVELPHRSFCSVKTEDLALVYVKFVFYSSTITMMHGPINIIWIIMYDALSLCWCCPCTGVVGIDLWWISDCMVCSRVTMGKGYSGLRLLTFPSSVSVFCCCVSNNVEATLHYRNTTLELTEDDTDVSKRVGLIERSSEACQGRARFQQHRDATCHQFFFSCKAKRQRKFTPFWQKH